MTKKDHLPFFGIGPLYVALIVALTAVGMILSANGCLDSGIIPALKIPMLVVGILVAALGAFIWDYAFFFDKIDVSIKNNRLCTDGIYAWVRNPLYVGWMFLCIGIFFCREPVAAVASVHLLGVDGCDDEAHGREMAA